jgi:hypothetical protein
MPPPFDLSVPSDAKFRVLAPEVTAKYAALAGCSEAEATAVQADVERAVASLAGAGENIALKFDADAGELRVVLTCGSASSTVRRALAAAK